ncbi:hypothetical protein B0H12DRAFT_1117955 [Mycena haematopus]|nr:hypothetical protein B0H12DRAFT_1117955 [Mycena haematopus]
MHRCLNISEIVDMICALLDPRISSVPGPTPYRHLASIARTCTALQGPALDHLWSSTTLSKILIRCMPSDLWAIHTVEGKWGEELQAMLLLRPVRDSDWNRIHSYASRVQVLSSGRRWSLHGIFPALSVALPDALFPNLQNLDWGDRDEDFHYIHLFLRPTLTKIDISPSSDSDSSLLSTLTAKCPRLTDIAIRTYMSPGVPVSEFVRDESQAAIRRKFICEHPRRGRFAACVPPRYSQLPTGERHSLYSVSCRSMTQRSQKPFNSSGGAVASH